MSIEGYILVIFFCILLSFFFAGSETGAISCSRIRIRHLMERGDRRGRILEELLAAPERLLALILVGNNLSNIRLNMALASVVWHPSAELQQQRMFLGELLAGPN